ncbi:hypothetical protein AVEN_42033-1 [Araneus ventricosus]|uniref:Uncharacterized protein n=1 Tax=Araneus ventricosus TaxID=182803 RepID=A0A4Y2MTI0_ARAVE|nr:hypothetical protein AVEN_42033-1 [Araneus ventricosus]
MRGQIAQAANTHIMKIGSSMDCKEWWHEKCSSYEGSEHLYATTAKFSGCVLLDSRPAYSCLSRRVSAFDKNREARRKLVVAWFIETKVHSPSGDRWSSLKSDGDHLCLCRTLPVSINAYCRPHVIRFSSSLYNRDRKEDYLLEPNPSRKAIRRVKLLSFSYLHIIMIFISYIVTLLTHR